MPKLSQEDEVSMRAKVLYRKAIKLRKNEAVVIYKQVWAQILGTLRNGQI
jgi:hypothetical protein